MSQTFRSSIAAWGAGRRQLRIPSGLLSVPAVLLVAVALFAPAGASPSDLAVSAGEPAPERTSPAGPEARGFASRDRRYRIDPTDVLEITFRFTPEFNQTVTVQPDGYIPLHTAGEVKVSGLTVPEVIDAIIQKYSGILNQPVVTVVLKEFAKPYFLVGGEVQRPGRFDLRGDVTLTDAVTMAGGFNPSGKRTEVLLFRRISREVAEVKKVDVKQIIEKGLLAEDIFLQSGDAVYVSSSLTGKIERFLNVTKLGFFFNPIPRF